MLGLPYCLPPQCFLAPSHSPWQARQAFDYRLVNRSPPCPRSAMVAMDHKLTFGVVVRETTSRRTVRLIPDGLELRFRNLFCGELRIMVDDRERRDWTFGHHVPPINAGIAVCFKSAIAILPYASN